MPVKSKGRSFEEQKAVGQSGESVLDHYLGNHYDLEKPPLDSEIRWKFDRFLCSGKKRYTVEYKTDTIIERTGNLFIETVSNTETEAPGWALNSVAQVVCYLFEGNGRVLFLDMVRLRMSLPHWRARYSCRAVRQDDGSFTRGLLVPVKDAWEQNCVLAELQFS